MKYAIWGIFAGRPARVFGKLTAGKAANWIVRLRAVSEQHGYWLESD